MLYARRGGGGVRARLRSLYIIFTTPITFFAILPQGGALLAYGYHVGVYPSPLPHTPMQGLYVLVGYL